MGLSEEQIENRRLWCEALRSGKYEKTKGTLKWYLNSETARFCCLGVACEIMPEKKLQFDLVGQRSGSCSPEKFEDTFGKRARHVEDARNMQDHLIYSNDKLSLPFSEIADLIDADTKAQS